MLPVFPFNSMMLYCLIYAAFLQLPLDNTRSTVFKIRSENKFFLMIDFITLTSSIASLHKGVPDWMSLNFSASYFSFQLLCVILLSFCTSSFIQTSVVSTFILVRVTVEHTLHGTSRHSLTPMDLEQPSHLLICFLEMGGRQHVSNHAQSWMQNKQKK